MHRPTIYALEVDQLDARWSKNKVARARAGLATKIASDSFESSRKFLCDARSTGGGEKRTSSGSEEKFINKKKEKESSESDTES
jgi:hypothetical protein